MDPFHSAYHVHDLAGLLTVARDVRIAVEKAKRVELIDGFPVNHSPHLPTGVFPRGTGIRARHNLA
jgi:hypothetical protein